MEPPATAPDTSPPSPDDWDRVVELPGLGWWVYRRRGPWGAEAKLLRRHSLGIEQAAAFGRADRMRGRSWPGRSGR